MLVFTHDPKLDVPALIAAFGTGAGYIGALGSRKTTADRERRLREAGANDADIARLYAPCGLDIGASTVRRPPSRCSPRSSPTAPPAGVPLRESSGPIRRERDGAPELSAPMAEPRAASPAAPGPLASAPRRRPRPPQSRSS